jgi:hypothetical protein
MMNLMHWEKRMRWISGAAGVVLISSLAGCNQDEPKVYHIAKDDSSPPQPEPASLPPATPAPESTPPAMPQPDMSSPQAAGPSLPALSYQLPEGWQQKTPTEMRVASFTAPGPNGQSADVSVIPLPVVGRDLELINMWRSRVQLPATTDSDAVNQAQPVAIGSEQGRLFEFVSDKPLMGNSRQRIIVAMLTRDTMSWFFKITGQDEFVTSQKEKFLQFLKSVTFEENANVPMELNPIAPAPNEATGSVWTVPSGWQSVPPSQFLLAEYSIPGANGAKAEVNVASMGGEGGGLLANVNRWRGQLGLAPLGDNDLTQLAQPLDGMGGTATLVDFTGIDAKTSAPTRLVGVIVAQGGQTWFYKLMGDKQVVALQKDAFTKFIQSANYANAR